MGHGHGPPPYIVPTPDQFKLEDAPELLKYQQELAKKGLKDPWIRNHAWKYQKRYGTRTTRAIRMLTTGIPTGLVFFGITLAIENYFNIDWHAYKHEHGAHDEGDHH